MNKWDLRGLDVAQLVATWSKDPNTKVGCAIFDIDHKLLGVGYNGFPRGVEDELHLLNDKKEKYPRIVHAETNAILNSFKGKGMTLYSTMFPCADCAGLIIQHGIERVVTSGSLQHWSESCAIAEEMFLGAGIETL